MSIKICNKCKIPKELDQFYKDKTNLTGYCPKCKECKKKYEESLKDKKQVYLKQYYQDNKKHILSKSKEYDLKNKDIKSSYQKEYFPNYYEKNKDLILQNGKDWYLNNIEYAKLKAKDYFKIQYKTNPQAKLRNILRGRLNEFLKRNKTNKSKSALILLGCTILEFKQYLEDQFKPEMSWSNHGTMWEIDHIISCSSFDLTILEEQAKCFHYSNMQPLFKTTLIAEDLGYINYIGNREKGNK